jgi:hypothetical protein
MDTLMNIQSSPLGKGLITYMTDVWTLSSMYMFLFCQATLRNKTVTTQITGTWIVITMPEHVFFQSPKATE